MQTSKQQLISLADNLTLHVRHAVGELAEACGGKDNCTDPPCMFHKVTRHKDPRPNPLLNLCYPSTFALYHLLEMFSDISRDRFQKLVRVMKADSPTGATHSKGAMKHFWLDIDGEVFDPSYTQYVIGKTKLPDHSLGKIYKSPHGTLKPERVKPIMRQTLLSLI